MSVIRFSRIKAQRKKTVRATAGTQLRQGFSYRAARSSLRLSASAPSALDAKLGVPMRGSRFFASLRCDGPSRLTALRNYPQLLVLLRCALRTTPSNSAVIAR
jgi:hypothetical protein